MDSQPKETMENDGCWPTGVGVLCLLYLISSMSIGFYNKLMVKTLKAPSAAMAAPGTSVPVVTKVDEPEDSGQNGRPSLICVFHEGSIPVWGNRYILDCDGHTYLATGTYDFTIPGLRWSDFTIYQPGH
jgi:hypothetical protein